RHEEKEITCRDATNTQQQEDRQNPQYQRHLRLRLRRRRNNPRGGWRSRRCWVHNHCGRWLRSRWRHDWCDLGRWHGWCSLRRRHNWGHWYRRRRGRRCRCRRRRRGFIRGFHLTPEARDRCIGIERRRLRWQQIFRDGHGGRIERRRLREITADCRVRIDRRGYECAAIVGAKLLLVLRISAAAFRATFHTDPRNGVTAFGLWCNLKSMCSGQA